MSFMVVGGGSVVHDPQETFASLSAQEAVTREAVIRLQDAEGRT